MFDTLDIYLLKTADPLHSGSAVISLYIIWYHYGDESWYGLRV